MTLRPANRLPSLHRLRAFDSVGRAGTMSGAAGALHLTQPAITRSVRALERQLAAKLLERTRSGSFLTEEGRILDRRTRRFFQQLQAAVAAALECDAGSEAVVRLMRKISEVHIRGLIAIARTQNFRRAAAALGIAEPTLHRPARDLERLVGQPLFRRTFDGIGLSPAGAELARRFTLASAEIQAGIDDMAIHNGAAAMRISVGVLVLAPKRRLSIVTETMLARHPAAQLTIQEGGYDELIGAMRSGAIDIIFGALRSPPPFGDLAEEALFEDPYCVVCRRGHPLTQLRRPGRADLRQYDWIFPTSALPRRDVLDTLIAEWRLSSRMQLETNSLSAVTSALAVSDRISLLPREYLAEDQPGALAVLDIRVPARRRMVGLTTRLDWFPTALHADFMALLRDAYRGAGRSASTANRMPRRF
ncbi:MAG: LysR family transcriptional regulator [Pseudolabrys sp.]|nr:LysR family transcriptional regulator [Pseudolabrys sp.]